MSNVITDKDGIQRYLVTIKVNGDAYTRVIKANTLLVNFLREDLDLTGTKRGCELGNCGSCTVLVDGKPIDSCMLLAMEVDGREITTIEGVASSAAIDVLQEEFIKNGSLQCGYCTPGMILSAKALLTKNAKPTEHEVRKAISGNLCRCTGFVNIVKAVMAASGQEVSQ